MPSDGDKHPVTSIPVEVVASLKCHVVVIKDIYSTRVLFKHACMSFT